MMNSRHSFFLNIIKKLFKNPRLMLRVINFRRIKNFFVVYKQEGMRGVRNHYELIEELENAKLNPLETAQIEIEKIDLNAPQTLTSYEKITFEVVENPVVTVVIPVYNQFVYTYHCLSAIRKYTEGIQYEILIADDCSDDLTSNITEIIQGIRVIRTNENQRFLRNCNNAAGYAKGKYIVFLNNDTQVQKNWLASLLELMEKDEKIGMTGSKLIYEDGWLQEAGGIVWKDASAWNYGNRKNPNNPEYNYVKDADYISGASIMIRADLWREIGGFDERYAPAYYEDTDLAFEVRKRGYRVVYQPLSVVVHFEGRTNGTDVSEGQKSYQLINKNKFYDKWKEVLKEEQFDSGMDIFLAKDRSRDKKHILIIDHYVPHYDQDAGGRCTYMYMLLFVKMGFKVTFIGDDYVQYEPYTTELHKHGIEVLYGDDYYKNWKTWLIDNLKYFDYVYLQRPHISIKYIDIIKQYSKAKVLYFAHDLHYIRCYREYELTQNESKKEASEKWKKIEFELFEKADVGHVVGSYEQAIMQKEFPDKPIRNIPLYIYTDILNDINKDFSSRRDLLYVGGFGHAPNIDAVNWFGKEVLPVVINKYPDIKWHVVGSRVPAEIQELASDNIIIHGFLSDEELEELYRTCRIDIVPLRVGAGVKGKVVEAAYYQIPLITTTIGGEGLDTSLGNMLLNDDAALMAKCICDLYEDYEQLCKMSDAGKVFIERYFTEDEARRVLELDIE